MKQQLSGEIHPCVGRGNYKQHELTLLSVTSLKHRCICQQKVSWAEQNQPSFLVYCSSDNIAKD